MSKNVLELEGPQITSQYGAYALHAGISKAKCTQAHAHAPGHKHASTLAHTQICNTYCFSTATTMIRERPQCYVIQCTLSVDFNQGVRLN
jgi:hypothetical protein